MPPFKEVRQAYLDAARALGFTVPADWREYGWTTPEGTHLDHEDVLDYVDPDEADVGDDMLTTILLPYLDNVRFALQPGQNAVVMVPYLIWPSMTVCLASNVAHPQDPV
jgi:hypothetical protein